MANIVIGILAMIFLAIAANSVIKTGGDALGFVAFIASVTLALYLHGEWRKWKRRKERGKEPLNRRSH